LRIRREIGEDRTDVSARASGSTVRLLLKSRLGDAANAKAENMVKVVACFAMTILSAALVYGAPVAAPRLVRTIMTPALASPAGEACRKQICDGAVAECLRADLSLNRLARTESEKQQFCAQFFSGCMSRTLIPNTAWYTPAIVARFLNCPA
jgi:hypothetical protein